MDVPVRYRRMAPPRSHLRRAVFIAAIALSVLASCAEDAEDEDTGDPTDDPGVELSVEPECVEISDSLTVTATGLEPGAQYDIVIDPVPEPMKAGSVAEADEEGVAELPGTIPDTAEPDFGDHTWSVSPTGEDEVLATTTMEIAEQCPTDVEEGAWQELSDAPIPSRINHSVTWAGDRVVVWGGGDSETLQITNDGAAWEPATGEWQDVPEAPIEGRWAHDAVWTGSELLVWGGSAGPDHLAECFMDGARYDAAAVTWAEIPEAPGPMRCAATVLWTGDELIVVGGHASAGPPSPGDRLDDGIAYDPTTDQWRQLPSAPGPARAGAVGGWVDGHVVIYGGHTDSDDAAGFDYFDDGAVYDPATDEWREMAESPLPPLSGLEGISVDDELVVLGGQGPDAAEQEPSTAVAAYDPVGDEWSTLTDIPFAHTSLVGAWTGDVLYVLGGGPPAPSLDADEPAEELPTFMAYVADEDSWLERPEPPGGPRQNHAATWTGAMLIVWGGQAPDEPDTPMPAGLRWDPPA